MELKIVAAPSVRVVMWRTRLAAVIGILAAAVGVRTVVAYFSHGAYFALAAVLVLIAVDAAGLWSIMRARAEAIAQWRALFAAEPASRLWMRRRDRLRALKAQQIPPDIDALMAVDEAELAGMASFGRYLVAASVLIGLVGTFAGLSETIAGFAPVMGDVSGELGTRLLAPLSGLEVTFGASIVAIIATLALSLASGDLALAERALLARLEERTRHELVPEFFPASESVAAQTLVALAAMTTTLSREWALTTAAQAERMEAIVAVSSTALTATTNEAVARLEQMANAIAKSFAETAQATWAQPANELRVSAERLAFAAQAMAATTEGLHPSIERLAPELAALARETALLAARVDDAEVDEAVLAEMQRLGEAMGEIKALLTLGRVSPHEVAGAEP